MRPHQVLLKSHDRDHELITLCIFTSEQIINPLTSFMGCCFFQVLVRYNYIHTKWKSHEYTHPPLFHFRITSLQRVFLFI